MTGIERIGELIAAGNQAYASGRMREALAFAERAVALEESNPHAQNLLGAVLAEEMEHEDARRAFAAAVAANPSLALSHVNLAFSMILAGDFADAERELRTALEIEPESSGAFLNLAWIRTAAPGDPLIDRLAALRKKGGADDDAHARYCFALGKCYDDVGDYDRAFECFDEGNARFGVTYDGDAAERNFAAIKQIFDKAFFRDREAAGYRSTKPVFVVGFPRCGSSLLEDRLARHPAIAALGERPDIGRILQLIGANHPARLRYPDWAPDLPSAAYARFGRHYAETFERRFPQARHFVDKNLLNFRYAGFIKTMLPDATLIDCRRGPLDTCLSCYFQNLRRDHHYKFSLRSLGRYYRLYDDLMAHWRERLDCVTTVSYETLVQSLDTEFARVVAALGLKDAPSSAAGGVRHMQTSSAFQARQPVYQSSVARWKRYEKHLGPLIDALGDLAR